MHESLIGMIRERQIVKLSRFSPCHGRRHNAELRLKRTPLPVDKAWHTPAYAKSSTRTREDERAPSAYRRKSNPIERDKS